MLITLSLFLTVCLLHPVHETVVEVDWNAESKRLEVGIRLHLEDEQWMTQQIEELSLQLEKRPVSSQDSSEPINLRATKPEPMKPEPIKPEPIRFEFTQLTYLRSRVRVSTAPTDQKAARDVYHWVGREAAGAYVWWYFEIEPKSGKKPVWLETTLLLDRNDDYVHRIVFLGPHPKQAQSVSGDRPRATFPETP